MASKIKPTAIALVVCDNIYTEPGGKTALVGLFNGISTYSQTGPIRHPRMAVFASLTGVREGSTARLEIVNAETDDPIVTAQGPLPNSPINVVDMNFILNNVVFPDAGTYYIRFWANDHLLVMRPFQVRRIKKAGGDKDVGGSD